MSQTAPKELRGMASYFDADATIRQHLVDRIRMIVQSHGFCPAEMPIVEDRSVFARAVGTESDIVKKEMFRVYGIKDDTDWVLRPEGTAQVMRSRVKTGQGFASSKIWYTGPMFRYERPQKGRMRQFTQIGCEWLDDESIGADIQMLLMGQAIMQLLPQGAVELHIGSLGCEQCRPEFRKVLVEFLQAHADALCEDCNRRTHSNPLRALDCKNPNCKEIYRSAPSMQQSLCGDCSDRQDETVAALEEAGVTALIDPTLVRGLDYYGGVVFEWITDMLGAQSAVCAGGRYDALSQQYGKQRIPAIGFALGLERLVELVGPDSVSATGAPDVRIVLRPEVGWSQPVFAWAEALRSQGYGVEIDASGRSIKSAMRNADRQRVTAVIVVGATELESGKLNAKRMADGELLEVALQADSIQWDPLQALLGQKPQQEEQQS